MLGIRHYILVGQTPVECSDLMEWAKWMEQGDRQVGLTRVGEYGVSTVFLGVEHAGGNLFETMVFPWFESVYEDGFSEEGIAARKREFKERGLDMALLDDQWRYLDWGEAELGHGFVVLMIEERTGVSRWT